MKGKMMDYIIGPYQKVVEQAMESENHHIHKKSVHKNMKS